VFTPSHSLTLSYTPGLALALTLGLPFALAPGLPLGPQPYNPFVFGPGPKARVTTTYKTMASTRILFRLFEVAP